MGKYDLLTTLTLDSSGYAQSAEQIKNKNKELSGGFSDLTSVLGKIGLAFGAGATALKVFNGVMESSQKLSEEWKTVQQQSTDVTETFFKVLGQGDFQNFIDRLVSAADAGKEYVSSMKDITDSTRSWTVQESLQREQITDLTIQMKNSNRSIQERISISEKIKSIEMDLANTRKTNAEALLKTDLQHVVAIQTKDKAQQEVLKKEITAYVTEYDKVKPIIEQGKEYNDLLKKRTELQNLSKPSVGSAMFGGTTSSMNDAPDPETAKKIAAINIQIAAMGDEYVKAGKQASDILAVDDKQLNKIAQDYVDLGAAQDYFGDATKRVQKNEFTLQKELNDLNQKALDIANKKAQIAKDQAAKTTRNDAAGGALIPLTPIILPLSSEELTNASQKLAIPPVKVKVEMDLKDASVAIAKWLNENEKSIDQLYQSASAACQGFTSLFEMQKNRELAAAGNNKKKQNEINKEYAKKEKDIALVQAAINTALGVTQALGQGGILGLVTGAIVLAAGIAEIAEINSEKFASGGIVRGNQKIGDHVNVMANAGEMILNDSQQARLFNTINSGKVGSNTNITGEFKLRGQDLYASINNVQNKTNSYS